MRTQLMLLCLSAALLNACGDDASDDGAPRDEARDIGAQKAAARADLAAAEADGSAPGQDPCTAHAWYEDGECDVWCPKGDEADCTVSNDEPIFCALFFSPADGECDESDPCGPVQDEDCKQDPSDGEDGVACPEPWSEADGACDPNDPCGPVQDPDCQGGGDGGGIACPAIWSPADGKCDESNPCGPYIDEDCQGVACIELLYPTNGKCEPAKGCEYTDPKDCGYDDGTDGSDAGGASGGSSGSSDGSTGVACILIAYETNGTCEAAPGCESTDPVDCQ